MAPASEVASKVSLTAAAASLMPLTTCEFFPAFADVFLFSERSSLCFFFLRKKNEACKKHKKLSDYLYGPTVGAKFVYHQYQLTAIINTFA